MTKLVILDRDGVINLDSPNFIKSPQEWIPIPGSLEAIARLNQAGFKIAVATNQSGIAKGLFTLDILESIHLKMRQALLAVGGHIDGIFFCPHTDTDYCNCRKPKAGLFEQIADFFQIKTFEREAIFAIGDSLRDLEAAKAAHFSPIIVLTGNGEKTLTQLPNALNEIEHFEDLSQAATWILEN
jgi:D-glycero-D-manno-heptose 1,7-bisphosphate phosphatase